MSTITTARILADRVFDQPCGDECVDWATSMLEQGRTGRCLEMLAGMSPPFNHFEIADFRDRALHELGLNDISESTAVNSYSAEQLRQALAGEVDIGAALRVIKDLYIASNYQKELYDFYLLYFAYTDLQEYEEQHYWNEANRGNIISIIRDRAEAFFKSTGNTEVQC